MQWGKLTIEFSYQAEEIATCEHPGCPEEVTIEDVLAGDISLCDELTWRAFKQVESDVILYVLEKMKEERENRGGD